MAKAIAARIPNCTLTVYPGKGHFFLFEYWAEILRALTVTEG